MTGTSMGGTTNGAARYPRIAPVHGAAERPFWSVMIPTYNRPDYLEETLRSVLGQDPGPEHMQIEVVDNASTRGDAEEIVRRVGGGRVVFHRHPSTIPAWANWNSCVERARGRWVHLLHDDDLALPGLYEHYGRLVREHPGVTMAIGACVLIDEHGRTLGEWKPMREADGPVEDFGAREAVHNWVVPPCVAIAREAYEQHGGYCDFLRHTMDWELYFRVGAAGRVVSTATPRSAYRVHGGSETEILAHTGSHVRDAFATVDLCFAQLPADVQRRLAPIKYRGASALAKHLAWSLMHHGHLRSGMRNATLALRFSPRDNAAFWLKSAAKA
ncbi:MAG: glycosyltransferase, partial [Gemmatimonadetes bacterium]|nr:glycosyltransferase [Gemmatimonadota bacterium]